MSKKSVPVEADQAALYAAEIEDLKKSQETLANEVKNLTVLLQRSLWQQDQKQKEKEQKKQEEEKKKIEAEEKKQLQEEEEKKKIEEAKKQAEEKADLEAKVRLAIKYPLPPPSVVGGRAKRDPDDSSSQGGAPASVIITNFIKPDFDSRDNQVKEELSAMKRIQEKALARIPTLSVGDDGNHNYYTWEKALLKYYQLLSPAFSQAISDFLSTLDVDNFIHSPDKVSFPELADDEFPGLMKLHAFSALRDTISPELSHFVDDCSDPEAEFNVWPIISIIHCTFAPNSAEDRSDDLANFWTTKMNSTETVLMFSTRISMLAKRINGASSHQQISTSQLLAAFKNGVAKGAKHELYDDALRTLKYKQFNNKPLTISATAQWLFHERVKEPTSGPQSVNMARTTSNGHFPGESKSESKEDGSYSGRGRGGKGGGRGRGGKGKGKGGKAKTYYRNTDQTGDETVTTPIPKRLNRPCFTYIQDGKCDRNDCPYNHNIQILDRRTPESTAAATAAPSQNSVHYAAAPTSTATIEEETDEEFNPYTDRGFGRHHAAHCATTPPSVPPFFSFPHFALPTTPPIFENVLSIFLLATLIFYSILPEISQLATNFVNLSVCVLTDLFCKLFRCTTALFCAAASNASLVALYRIILDCGCTFTMSGDVILFGNTLQPMTSTVSVANGVNCAATHYGKINVNGRLIDALYVPTFHQTMLSLGQLERQGLTYSQLDDQRYLKNEAGEIYLSFTLTKENLYILNPSIPLSSSANAATY